VLSGLPEPLALVENRLIGRREGRRAPTL